MCVMRFAIFDAPLDVESTPKWLLVNLSETAATLIESEPRSLRRRRSQCATAV